MFQIASLYLDFNTHPKGRKYKQFNRNIFVSYFILELPTSIEEKDFSNLTWSCSCSLEKSNSNAQCQTILFEVCERIEREGLHMSKKRVSSKSQIYTNWIKRLLFCKSLGFVTTFIHWHFNSIKTFKGEDHTLKTFSTFGWRKKGCDSHSNFEELATAYSSIN